MRISFPSLAELVSKLTGTGAVRNAHDEVTDTASKVTDLDSQLLRVIDPTPRRAA
ncbi:MAG TPA: hypothetical protein VED63_07965 [Acidimicrobiales bacterium]|nr:hypothetical protein [Acidimicrobiales bacterium]